METNQQNEHAEAKEPKLELTNKSINYLKEMRKWAKFLAILGFISIGLLVVAGFSMGTLMAVFGNGNSPLPGYVFGIIYIIFGVIYFFPIWYLYKFSQHSKNAFRNKNTNDLNSAFENLKAHYKYIGIMTIILFGFYILIFLFSGLAALLTNL